MIFECQLAALTSKNDIKARDPSMSHEEFFQRRENFFTNGL